MGSRSSTSSMTKIKPPRKPEDLPRNLLVVGHRSSSAIANLEHSADVQVRDYIKC